MAMIDFPPLTRSRDLDCKYIQMNEGRKQFLGKLTFTHWFEEDHLSILPILQLMYFQEMLSRLKNKFRI